MEDGGIGGLIFYIIAAIVGIVGSIASKKKKKEAEASFPDFEIEGAGEADNEGQGGYDPFSEMKRQMEEVLKGYPSQEASMSYEDEGTYEEPMAAAASAEGASALAEAMNAAERLEKLKSDSATLELHAEDTIVSNDLASEAREEAEEFEIKRAIVFAEILQPKYLSY